MSRLFALLCGICFCSVASAQIIYQPMQYQYGTQSRFYYGGSDPYVIARGLEDDAGRCGTRGYSTDAPTRIYCDCMPANARVYGMTAADAANEASMNSPRYFRKRDLLAAAIPQSDGSLLVPAQAHPIHGTIIIKPYRAMHVTHSATQPAQPASAPGGPVFIFPKEILDRPLHPKSDSVTLAQ